MRTVDELMTGDVVTVAPLDEIAFARRTMLRGHLHGLPVLDPDGALVGIVTASHLVDRWPAATLVEHVMTPDPPTISRHTAISDAAQIMVDHHIHHLVVVDRTGVVGIVSSWDFLRCLLHESDAGPVPDATPSRLEAHPGDVIVVRPALVGGKERRATVVETLGTDGTAPFTVRWADDQRETPRVTMFFPGSDSYVERPAPGSVGGTAG